MTCRLCAWLCDRLCPPDANGNPWRAAYDWEEHYASDWEPAEEGDDLRRRWHEAENLVDENPARALAIYVELAEAGSPFSMLRAGRLYEDGHGTEPDPAVAEDYYRRALSAGSWRATIRYADLLFKRGAHDKWPSTLGDGVQKGFIPSCFWLAWYHYKRMPSRRSAREVRPLLEAGVEAGHPGAIMLLARWTASGKFGVRKIPDGLRMIRTLAQSYSQSESRNEVYEPVDVAMADVDVVGRVVWKGGRL
jgi:TPR repeat protein